VLGLGSFACRLARRAWSSTRSAGKSVGDALATLEFTPRAAARLIEKVLRSAVANAEHNHQVRNLDDLRVVQAIADGGPSLKRVQPRAMGRAFFIKHRTSHLTIAVERRGQRYPGCPDAAAAHAMRRLPSTAPAATAAPAASAPAAKARPGRTSSSAPRGKSRTKPREKK
jgi:large subunit ribosomal protein L22